jgi:hypothetical protein
MVCSANGVFSNKKFYQSIFFGVWYSRYIFVQFYINYYNKNSLSNKFTNLLYQIYMVTNRLHNRLKNERPFFMSSLNTVFIEIVI